MLTEARPVSDRLTDARRTLADAGADLCRRLADKLEGEGFSADGVGQMIQALDRLHGGCFALDCRDKMLGGRRRDTGSTLAEDTADAEDGR